MLTKDEDGRFNLSGRERNGILCLLTAINELEVHGGALKDRLKKIPYGWRDYKLILAVARSLWEALLLTVPKKKLLALDEELKYAHIELKCTPFGVKPTPQATWITQDLMKLFLDEVFPLHCMICDKKPGTEVRKCVLRQKLDEGAPMSVPVNPDGTCPLYGLDGCEIVGPEIRVDEDLK